MNNTVKIGKYFYTKSTRKGKKLMTTVGSKIIHFGSSEMEQFFDKTRFFESKNHMDPVRRKNYLSRSAGIKDGKGNLTKDNPLSPNYHARRVLW